MDAKEKLKSLRREIDGIDGEICALFEKRMGMARVIADLKGSANLPLTDEARENQIVDRAAAALEDKTLSGETKLLMRYIIGISKEQQRKILLPGGAPLLPPPAKRKEKDLLCAYQGTPGAWSEQALVKLFPDAAAKAVEFFEDIFVAVKRGEADYGVAPIENSKTGAIGETYDLLRKYGCFVVGRTWIDIQQCLLAPLGTELSAIREVYSHPEGFKQCMNFLRGKSWDLTSCRNTAVAAETAAASTGGRTAAIGSRRAAALNGLKVLAPDIMDSQTNRTSFVVIGREPEYTERDNLISLTFSTAHRSGALCEILLPFMAGGLNLTRIESRPSSQDSYRFFLEVRGNIMEENTVKVLRHAAALAEYLEIIGCYSTL